MSTQKARLLALVQEMGLDYETEDPEHSAPALFVPETEAARTMHAAELPYVLLRAQGGTARESKEVYCVFARETETLLSTVVPEWTYTDEEPPCPR